jgi:ABC-type Fe3+/spermidine/putrescine transport system ATPase subunit
VSASVELMRVGKRYGSLWALRDVSLRVEPGEFFTLLGPSGCGKTTALRVIAGFLDPDEGRVLIDGASVIGVPPWRRDLGLVFQNYALWPHLSVFEHVAFGLRERRVPRAERVARVREALRLVSLEDLADRRPSQLSGGQQQRVALARTLVLRPRALLLDEPLSNLDAALRAQMRLELRRLHRDLGITTIFVTHDQAEAMALSTRIAVFDRGAVMQVGTPAEVYRRPLTRFVAEFLGAANLLEGRVERGAVRVNDLVLHVADLADEPVSERTRGGGAAVLCVVRPEAIQRVRAGEIVPNRVEATVVSAVYLGGRHECELALPGGLRLRAELAAHGGAESPKPGESLTVAVAPEDVIVIAQP